MHLTSDGLLDRLRSQVVVADGAMGTVLSSRELPLPYELANLTHPDLVRVVHGEYITAGANLIETNTFGANRVKMAGYALDRQIVELNRAGARLAREAAAGREVLVAGAMGPCGKSLAPVGAVEPALAEAAFREQAAVLLDEGVDLILLETFTDLEELRIAHRVVREFGDVPVIAMKVFIEDGEALGSGLPARVAAEVGSWDGVAAVGANCAVGPQRMREIVRAMASATPTPICAMPTPGLPQRIGSVIRYAVTPEYFGEKARALVEAGASLIGGCCGTTPEHIAAIAASVAAMAPVVRTIRVDVKEPSVGQPAPVAAVRQVQSSFAARLGKEYVSAVELDLPRGLDMSKVLDGARSLKAKGVDIVDISDGARARLRMNAMSVAHLVQEHAGVDVMLHFACRDRNLLAIQADLLGAHALGIRHILAVTGDPAMIGDYPAATSVYDVDSVGLVRVLRRFNEGVDLAGNALGATTAFTIAVAFDPLSDDLPKERERLSRKVAEGAHCVYTQPIFDLAMLHVAAECASHAGVPLLFGLLPLRSSRHCEFMHNEVPGIRIPRDIRGRMAELGEEDARRYGLDVARDFLRAARPVTQGVYMMPPFGNHRVAESLLRALD